MGELWDNVKPIVEAGVLGAMLLLMIRLWIMANKTAMKNMEERVKDEKEHSKAMLKLQTDHNKALAGLVRQYDTTLTAINATLDGMNSQGE